MALKKSTLFPLISVVVFTLGLWIFWQSNALPQKKVAKKGETVVIPTVLPTGLANPSAEYIKTIFVPNYACDGVQNTDINSFDRMVYFGVTATVNGVNKNDAGYSSIDSCLTHFIAIKNKYLTLKLLNQDDALAILKSKEAQTKIIKDVNEIARKYNFSGILLDLEISGIFQDSVPVSISTFVKDFADSAHQNTTKFAVTAYGDTFYRKRPFDLKALSQSADEIIVMAYDFHKPRGEPGPNFPLDGKDVYGYDFLTMLDDFLATTAPEKLTIAYGMYGYDWLVDETKKPIRQATAVTYNQVKEKFLDKCKWKNCLVRPDDKAAETEVNYIDEYLGYHVVWFEDAQSVEKKMQKMKDKGITGVAYWAYTFFKQRKMI